MAITDSQTKPERDPAESTVYDGFISYSHAADDLLAPRLQAGLQRFAKPWWKRRALRIFRDESSLTANPHLWASIAEAMDDSGWFVLLLSPDAADSEWVNREVEYWVENKDPNRIIPVLTDGDFAWHEGHIVSNAAPPALVGAFADEPRWVDLRFAHTGEQLDLRNGAFRAAVADIASAIRGVPKDELESEEVRQHRRTIRTAWAGVFALLVLAIMAAGAAVYAVGQRNEATRLARQALDFSLQLALSDASPAGSNFESADSAWIPVPVGEKAPDTPRLDFLNEFCGNDGLGQCIRDADYVPLPDGWGDPAYEPFHIRHGFVSTQEADEDRRFAENGFDLHVYVTRTHGPELDDDSFEIGTTYLFRSDYMVIETSERCGRGYKSQTEPKTCDLFVHEFDDGLPAGRYDFWVEWRAPCSAWTVRSVCPDPDRIVSLFASSVNIPFYDDRWTAEDDPRG